MQQARTAPQAPAAPQVPPADLGAQIRQQVQREVAAAREQARQAQQQSGVTVAPPFPGDLIPPQVVDISIAFFVTIAVIVVGYPLARAIARFIDRRGQAPALPAGLPDQLQRIEHTVEAMAIEIERISEAQRYMARLQTERAPAAIPSQQGAS